MSEEEDEKLAQLLRASTSGMFEGQPEERRVALYAVYMASSVLLSSAFFYQVLALSILAVLQAVGVLTQSFPIFMTGFLIAIAGAVAKVILWKLRL